MKNAEKREPDRGVGSAQALVKYYRKLEPGRIGEVFGGLREQMAERYQAQALVLARVAEAVAKVTDPAGVPRMTRFWYQVFGREVYRVWRRPQYPGIEQEFQALEMKWRARGLDPKLLRRVRDAVVQRLNAKD
ncbi:MAG: hypothetical protein ABIK44_02935 [candidate division WOR-3 bacterium]